MQNLGWATLQVIPSLRDVSRNVTRQLQGRLRNVGRDAGRDYGRGVADGVDQGLRGVDTERAGRDQGRRYGTGFVAGVRSGMRNIVAGFALAHAAASGLTRHIGTAATALTWASRAARGLSVSMLAASGAVRLISGHGLAKLGGILRVVAAVAGHVAREIGRITAALLVLRAAVSVISTLTRLGRVLGLVTVGSAVALGAVSALAPAIAALGSALITVGAAAGGAAVAGLSALGAAAATVKVGLFGVGDAFKAMGKGATGGGGAAVDTAKQVERAQHQLSRAVKDERDAQKDVGKARDDARKKLRDLSFELKGAALSEKDAELSLREARADLAAGNFETATERERAVLRVQEAELRLNEVQKDNGDLAERAADARAKGVDKADDVVQAQDRLAEATRAVKDAQDSLNEARKPPAGAAGADPFAEAMAKLSTNAQATLRAVKAVTPEWENLRKSVQDNLFAGIADQVQPLAATWFPRLGESMRTVASGFNEGARSAIGWAQSTQGINVAGTWMRTASAMAAELGRAVGNLLPGFAAIGAGAGQAFGPMTGGLAEAAKGLSDWLIRMQQSGKMADFFKNSVATIGQVFRNVMSVAGPLITAFRQLGATSASGLAPGFRSMGTAIAQATPGLVSMAERLMPALGQALSNLAPILPGLVHAFSPWATTLSILAPHLGTIVAKLAPMAPYLLGAAVVVKVITTAYTIWNATMFAASVAQGIFYAATGRSTAGIRTNLVAMAAHRAAMLTGAIASGIASAAMTAFGAALRFAMGPIGLIIIAVAAIGAGLVLLYKKNETFRNIVQAVWNSIKVAIGAVWGWLSTTVWPWLQQAFKTLGDVAMWLWRNVMQPVWTGIKFVIGLWWQGVQIYFTAWKIAINAVGAVVSWLWRNVMQPAWTGIKFLIGLWWQGVQIYFTAWKTAIGWVASAATWLWQNVMVPVWNGIKGAIDKFWGGTKAVFGWIRDKFTWVGDVAVEVKDRIVRGFDKIVEFVKGLPARIANAATGMWNGIKDTFKSVLNWIIQKWNDFHITMKVPDNIPMIGGKGFTINTPDLPMLAGGGTIGGSGGARRHRDGRLSGPGTGTSDSIFGVDRFGIPRVRIAAGEGVVMERAMAAGGDRVVAALNSGWVPSAGFLHGMLPGFADGGVLPKTLDGYTTPDGLTGGTVQLGNISGPGVTTGIQLSMWDAVRKAHPDAVLSSATRTVQTEGHADFHNAGKALDFGGPQAVFHRIAEWIAKTYPNSLELIHSPFNHNIKNGKDVGDGYGFYGTGTMSGHTDHTHWAVDSIIKPAAPAPEVKPPGTVPEQTPTPLAPETPTTPSPTTPEQNTTGSGETSISGRLGEIGKTVISEQVSDALGLIGLSDQPGWLGAMGKLEEQSKGGKWVKVSVKDAEKDVKLAADALVTAQEKRRKLPANADSATRNAANAEVAAAEKKLRDAQKALNDARANPNGRKWVPNSQNQQTQTPTTPTPDPTLPTTPSPTTPDPNAGVQPPTGNKKQIAGAGDLTQASPPEQVARAIVGEAQRRGYKWADAVAEVSTGLQESGLSPAAVGGGGAWLSIFQQDSSYPGRGNPNTNITGFFDRLDGKKHPDIWKRIFWLQQRPGEASADAAFANGRQAYLTEIQSQRGKAEQMVRAIVTPELFDTGGRLTNGLHFIENARGHDETILPQRPEDVFGALDAAIRSIEDYANGGGGRTVINNVTNATFRDENEYYTQARRRARMGMAQRGGGRMLVRG